MTIRPIRPGEEEAVVDLWHRCGLVRPQNDPFKDVARKLVVQPDMLLVATDGEALVGSVMCGYDGHRGWVNYLAIEPARRRRGFGRDLMREAERVLLAAGCPKINLQVRSANRVVLAFYEAIGFRVDDVVSMGKRLEQD